MKSSIGIAVSVSYWTVPREPSSSETRAIVFSSGASTTLTKSKRPRTAHCAFTVAPSCSISLLTSRMRCGFVLIVCVPSGVSLESMMYVGMALPSLRSAAVLRHWFLSQRPARRIDRAARLLLKTMIPTVRSRHPPLLAALVGALACGPTAAQAATLTTDARCYAQSAPLHLTAGGLAPRAPLTVALDGQPLR